LLACSSVAYRGGNAAHIYLPLDDFIYTYRPHIRTNGDVNRLQYSYIIPSENASQGLVLEQKMF